jgi:hypothetical protein
MSTHLVLLLAAAAASAEPSQAWKQTDRSLALVSSQRVVWEFHYRTDEGKPFFHPLTVGGSDSLTDLRPADHRWHLGFWFSWKFLNGVNYWEPSGATSKADGETEVVQVKATPRDDHSARFELTLSYHPPGKPTVLAEQRIIEVRPPTKNGAYTIDWVSTFTAGDADVVLGRTPILGEPQGVGWGGYAGLSLRLAPTLRTWQFTGPDGAVKATTAQARWMSFSGSMSGGQSAAIVVLEHPQSFRQPTPWYLIQNMPYFSPAVLYRSPHTLAAKQSFALKYRILIQPGPLEGSAVEQEWQRFSREGGAVSAGN